MPPATSASERDERGDAVPVVAWRARRQGHHCTARHHGGCLCRLGDGARQRPSHVASGPRVARAQRRSRSADSRERQDRLTAAIAAEVVAQCLGIRVPHVGILRQQLGNDGLERSGHIGNQLVQWLREIVHLLVGDAHGILAGERRLARHHLVQHDAERVEVAARIGLRALCLLGREVRRRTHHGSDLGEVVLARRVHGPGDAEVGNLHLAVGADEDVRGLDVAVHHATRVRVAERCRDLVGDLSGLHRVDVPIGPQDVGQRAPLHVLHRHEVGVRVLAPVVDRDDVRMGQVGGGLGLASEPLDEVRISRELGKQHLDGHETVEQKVARQEDVGHATPSDALLNFVAVVENRPLAVVCHVLPTLLSCASNAPRGYPCKFVDLTSRGPHSHGPVG